MKETGTFSLGQEVRKKGGKEDFGTEGGLPTGRRHTHTNGITAQRSEA